MVPRNNIFTQTTFTKVNTWSHLEMFSVEVLDVVALYYDSKEPKFVSFLKKNDSIITFFYRLHVSMVCNLSIMIKKQLMK